METSNRENEHEPIPKDISAEFLRMNAFEFMDFLKTQRTEPALSIIVDWKDVPTAKRLKAFLEDFRALGKQKRSVTIKASEEQHDQEMNVFASGVRWEKV